MKKIELLGFKLILHNMNVSAQNLGRQLNTFAPALSAGRKNPKTGSRTFERKHYEEMTTNFANLANGIEDLLKEVNNLKDSISDQNE